MDTQQSENIKIIHININGISNKRSELIHYLNEHNPQFMTVNESKIRKQHKIKIPNYHIIRKDRENVRGLGGGAAILVRKDIKFDQIDTSEFNEEFLAISFISEKRKIVVATIYNPPNIKPNIDNFKHILNRCQHSISVGQTISAAGVSPHVLIIRHQFAAIALFSSSKTWKYVVKCAVYC